MKSTAALVTLPLLLAACSKAPATPVDGAESTETPVPEAKTPTPADKVSALNAAIDALMAKPEHKDEQVTVQHLLVGVTGPRIPVQRSPGEAETICADLYARILAGEDFDTLIKNYADDSHPGIYTMSLGQPKTGGVYPRAGMAPAFGDVGWRLQVGEYGVTRYDGGIPGTKPKSEFGYHIIKRIK